MDDQIKNLNDRLGNIIRNTCNKIGCEDCGMKWSEKGKEKCSATELQDRIFDLEKGLYE